MNRTIATTMNTGRSAVTTHSYTLRLGPCPQPDGSAIADVACENCGQHRKVTLAAFFSRPMYVNRRLFNDHVRKMGEQPCSGAGGSN